MRRLFLWLAITVSTLPALGHAEAFHFSVLMHVAEENTERHAWHTTLDNAQANEAAFIVVNGLKRSGERCSEALFQQRIDLLAKANAPVTLSMAATDWAY